ncbi:tartrate-resistant acid phosphatase type 5-like [Mytilus galloprovincialis]|uniref:tartrate-resistant acid phosphatase type 5-like n=1 Tax=Mytilus galloprovincialis TaxID=29158 RepID=UPI003F7BF42B
MVDTMFDRSFKIKVAIIFLHFASCLAVDSLRFLVMGDWGGLPTNPYTTSIETGTAKAMGALTSTYGTQFNLALGDNFYFDGVKTVSDARFKVTFDKVFTDPSLQKTPFYLVAGNHDHNGNVSAQIAYSKVEDRWNFPDYYYKLNFPIPGSQMSVDIIMIDTILLCGNSDHDFLGKQPKGPANQKVADDQLTWIEKQIQTSNASYLLVAGHYPVYSIAEHGPTDCLIDKLLPTLQKYKITAYLSGHDHNLQHLLVTRPGLKMNFFVSGGANFADKSNVHKNKVPDKSSKFFWAEESQHGGFAYVEALATNMTWTFVNGKSENLYQYVLYPRS